MKHVRQLVEVLRDAKGVNAPAAPLDLERLRSKLGVQKLPADVCAFYSLANGMADYESDLHFVSFWSIDRICREGDGVGSGDVAFADFSIGSWYFSYVLVDCSQVLVRCEGVDGAPVPFSEFAQAYLEGRYPVL